MTRVTHAVCATWQLVPSGKLYLVQRGLALYGGKVLSLTFGQTYISAHACRDLHSTWQVLRRGHCWGEDVMLSSPDLKRTWCAHALNYLEVRQTYIQRTFLTSLQRTMGS